MQKRSLTITSHKTSIALEPEFWEALELMASKKNISLIELIIQIDKKRAVKNLSSALRVASLKYFKQQICDI